MNPLLRGSRRAGRLRLMRQAKKDSNVIPNLTIMIALYIGFRILETMLRIEAANRVTTSLPSIPGLPRFP